MYQEFCRVCDGDLEDVLDLGEIHPSGFLKPGEPWPNKSPLILAECHNCSLVQLRHTVPLDSMYKEQYWYRSGLNSSMVADLKDVVQSVEKEVSFVDSDVVLDIGANDGTLFDFYTDKDHVIKVGYDPAPNLAEEAKHHCDYFINDYFSADFVLEKFGPNSVKAITAIAMFYDLPDPNWFLQEILKVLHPAGIFVVQFTDLLSMFKANAFDNVCHEHLEYYHLAALKYLLEKHGLEIYHVEYNKVNGGSLRAYIQFAETSYAVLGSVQDALDAEEEYMNSFDSPMKAFASRVESAKNQVLWYLNQARSTGGITEIHTLTASTKGNTLLQYFGITDKIIPYAAEINEDKYDLVTVGSNIYILSETDSLQRKPVIYLVLAWHFENTFVKFLHRIDNNPKPLLLFPLPEPRIYYKDDLGDYKWVLLKNQLELYTQN